MKIETIAVHGGYTPDPTTKAVAVPIYQTTSYAFDSTQHGADLFDLNCTVLCAVERRRFPAGANPARQLSLQPVAVGAVAAVL